MTPEDLKKLEELLKDPFRDVDQDNRWMNVNDLSNFLEKHSNQLDDSKKEAIIRTFLTGLNDRSSQVQEISTRSLSKSVNSLTEALLLQIVKTITESMLNAEGKKDSLKMLDVYSVCLRTLINNAQDQLAHNLTSAILQCTAGVWGAKDSAEVHEHMIDVMGTVLGRFGKVVEGFCGSAFNPKVFSNFLMVYVAKGGTTLRKKAAATFGFMGSFLNNSELLESLKSLFSKYKSVGLKEKPFYILAIHSVLENLQSKRDKLVSLLPEFLDKLLDDLSHFEAQQENEEYFDNLDATCDVVCLLLGSLEFLIHGISKANLETYHTAIRHVSTLGIKLLAFNPNQPEFLDYEVSEGEAEESSPAEDNDEDEEEPEDDDVELDSSRKVRRCACKLISVAISIYYPMMNEISQSLLDTLSKLIQYPDDLVQLQVCSLLKNVIQSTWYDNLGNENDFLHFTRAQSVEVSLNRARSQIKFSVSDFRGLTNVCMKVIHHKATPSPVRLGMLSVLTCFAKNDSSIVDDIVGASYKAVLAQMKASGTPAEETAEIMRLFQATLNNPFSFEKMEGLVLKLSELSVEFVSKKYQFSTAFEAAKLCRVVLKSLSQNKEKGKASAEKLVVGLLGHMEEERERDLKNALVRSAGLLLSKWKEIMIENPSLLIRVIRVILNRINDDGTCGVALASIDACTIEASELKGKSDVLKVGESLLIHLSQLLSKKLSIIREKAFSAFKRAYSVFGTSLAPDQTLSLVHSAIGRLSSEDELVIEETLLFVQKIIGDHKQKPETLRKINESIVQLVSKHQNLPNSVLVTAESTLEKVNGVLNAVELKAIVKIASSEINMTNFEQLSRLIGFIVHLEGAKAIEERVKQLVVKVSSEKSLKENALLLAEIQELGELGRHNDFSKQEAVQSTLLKLFDSYEDKVKRQAFMAYGTLTLGNLGFFLPKLLGMFDAHPNAQFIILHVLSEVISSATKTSFSLLKPIFSWIISKSGNKELLGSLAQCLGSLISLFSNANDPLFNSLLHEVIEQLGAPEKVQVRILVTKSIRISIDKKTKLADLMPIVVCLLPDLEKGEPEVRSELYHAFRDLIQSGIELSSELEQEMRNAIEKCEENLKTNPKFIQEVTLGLIKHSEDRGKDMRYYLLIFLESALSQQKLYSRVLQSLRPIIQHSLERIVDPFENIRNQALDVLNKSMKLSEISNEMLPHLELLVETLEKKIMEVCNVAASNRQEHQLHLLKFAAKLYHEINRNPVLSANPRFRESINLLERDSKFADFESSLLSWKI